MSSTETATVSKKQRVPELRFGEFDGGWNITMLEEICSFFSGGTPTSTNKKLYDGDIPFIGSGNINDSQVSNFITREALKSSSAKLVDKGDLLFALYGANSGDTGISKLSGAINQAVLCIRPEDYEIGFIHCLLVQNKGSIVAKYLQGGQGNLSAKIVKRLKFYFPTLPEQKKIASFLNAVDEKIQQLSKKKALLEQYKKGVMQQLFSQEVRFKDTSASLGAGDGSDFPEWEEKRLGSVLSIGSGKDYKHLKDGDIPVFGTGGYMLSVNEALYNGETVFLGRKGTIDKPFYYDGSFWTVDTLFYTHNFINVLPKFIHCLFQRVNWKLHNEASGVPSLSKATISSLKFKFPELKEQQKIATFITCIDTKIEQLTAQLEQAQKFKKGLLQQMFV